MNTNTVSVNVQLQLNIKGAPFKSQIDMLAWISACLNSNSNYIESTVTPTKIPTAVVNIGGGLIQEITASSAMRVIVLDADIDGAEDNIGMIDGIECKIINYGEVEIDADYVESVIIETV